MKNIVLSSALVAVLGFALASAPVTAQAQSTNATSATAPAPATAKSKEYQGKITAISATSVTVENKKDGSRTFAITADTKFGLKQGKSITAATAADFAVGDKISGSFIKNADGTMTAASIHKKKK